MLPLSLITQASFGWQRPQRGGNYREGEILYLFKKGDSLCIEAALGWLIGQAGNDRPDNETRGMPLHQINAHITVGGPNK